MFSSTNSACSRSCRRRSCGTRRAPAGGRWRGRARRRRRCSRWWDGRRSVPMRPGLVEAHVRPRLAGVGGLVDAVAHHVLSRIAQRFAGAGPHDVRIAMRDGQRADRLRPVSLSKAGFQRRAAVGRLPDAARRGAGVVDAGLTGDRRGGGDAAGARRPRILEMRRGHRAASVVALEEPGSRPGPGPPGAGRGSEPWASRTAPPSATNREIPRTINPSSRCATSYPRSEGSEVGGWRLGSAGESDRCGRCSSRSRRRRKSTR